MSDRRTTEDLTRRELLKACLVPAGLAATGWLVACGEKEPGADGGLGSFDASAGAAPNATTDAHAPTNTGGSRSVDAGANAGDATTRADAGSAVPDASAATAPDASAEGGLQGAQDASADAAQAVPDASGSAAADAATGNVPWATGGTKAMRGNYPDPFTPGSTGARCVLYPPQTLGPCYAQMPPTREDISEGMTGLPLRISFMVVRADGCTPVSNASIDIWHSGSNGIYSAFDPGTICNPESEDVLSKRFCRGVQTTDAQGKAHFSTIFPGWYTGRAIHIHFTVRISGREAITSQLYFDEKLNDELLAQGEYAKRGPRDTRSSDDFIFLFSGSDPAEVTFSTAKRADGALHAWKVLSIA